jgi:hypothetical protein
MLHLVHPPAVALLPQWTSSRTFGDPQAVILVILIVLGVLVAALGLFTLVREFRHAGVGRRHGD